MTRNEALRRLTTRLTARRDALRKSLLQDLEGFQNENRLSDGGDAVDAAVDTAREEISSQLVELECRELAQIEQALRKIAAGAYGRCERCGVRIPAGRLNVLPCTSNCIDCQRAKERSGAEWQRESSRWEHVQESPSEGEANESRINWDDFKVDFRELTSMPTAS